MVYFVPADRTPILDWRERLDYYAKRIEDFHDREFGTQSTLRVRIQETPFVSKLNTKQLRAGDANFIYFKTLEEVDQGLQFGRKDGDDTFPILLVMSEINWKPLDDFFRVRPNNGVFEFEGNYNNGRHYPGAESGGARAVYWDNRGVGWGLVSADGWRVPYSGSDCVVYHEGVGHTIGLPHPDDANPSVMSLGQYYGWINESYVDPSQKKRLGWSDTKEKKKETLFSKLTAIPEPAVPRPGEEVKLAFQWPNDLTITRVRIEYQTALSGPWFEAFDSQIDGANSDPTSTPPQNPRTIRLGKFDRPTPVSYRVRAEASNQESVELWGYFQIRQTPEAFPLPNLNSSWDLEQPMQQVRVDSADSTKEELELGPEINLLDGLRPDRTSVSGPWKLESGSLLSPKEYGARIELPADVPAEYQMVVVIEPLDEPNGLLLGQIMNGHRFASLFNYAVDGQHLNALENVDEKNVGNETTVHRTLFRKNRPSQIVTTVVDGHISISVDGVPLIDWHGSADQLSLSDYWSTPNANKLFIGAYDCRYRITRATLRAIEKRAP